MQTRRLGRPRADAARDLRADLLRIGRELLMEGGVAALRMRELARRAGCTHQAPYHYFADRETLLAALVATAFDDLARRLRACNDAAPTLGVRATLLASGRAYVDFALSQPGVFRLMFRADACDPQRFTEVRDAGGRAFAELRRLATIVHGPAAAATDATILWAHVHGLAFLLIDGPLARQFETDALRQAHIDAVAAQFADCILPG